ncbi:MAG TPA: hypothetical protein VMU89_17370 [Thermomicrobiaceae bacterium]|nr:hypothetical protein [Thermomicrobiaceae bacterium]
MSATSERAISRKEAIWLACRQKTCCSARLVTLTGRDVWRIARSMNVVPWSFLVYFESEPAPDAFALDHSGRRYRLALNKRPSRRTKTPWPCLFLLSTRDGHHLCGLGELRPQSCKAFPSEPVDGVLCLAGGCSCRTWALADVDIEEEAAAVRDREEELADYAEVVVGWNAAVAAAPEGVSLDLADYCRYLLEVYDAVETADPARVRS